MLPSHSIWLTCKTYIECDPIILTTLYFAAPLIETTTTASTIAFHYEGCFDDNLDGSGNDRIWPLTGSDPQGKEIDLGNANSPAK